MQIPYHLHPALSYSLKFESCISIICLLSLFVLTLFFVFCFGMSCVCFKWRSAGCLRLSEVIETCRQTATVFANDKGTHTLGKHLAITIFLIPKLIFAPGARKSILRPGPALTKIEIDFRARGAKINFADRPGLAFAKIDFRARVADQFCGPA